MKINLFNMKAEAKKSLMNVKSALTSVTAKILRSIAIAFIVMSSNGSFMYYNHALLVCVLRIKLIEK